MSENNLNVTDNIEVNIRGRAEFSMGGVKNVLGFDEGYVSLDTELGEVSVEGGEMKIETLSEDGHIRIAGRIDGVSFSARSRKGGFLSRLFG